MTTATCECCWITPVELSLRNSEPLCQPCRGHKFNIDNLRADHRRISELLIAKHESGLIGANAEIEGIHARLTQMRAERDALAKAGGEGLANASEDALKAIQAQALIAQQDDVRRAFRARDRAMDAVWTIDERHHAVVGEKCACGLALHACKEYRELDFFRDEYQRWERKQIELMKAGKDHGLPENHPEARKLNVPSHLWRGMRSTHPEQRRRQSA